MVVIEDGDGGVEAAPAGGEGGGTDGVFGEEEREDAEEDRVGEGADPVHVYS